MIPGDARHPTGTDVRALWDTPPAGVTTTVLGAPNHRLKAPVVWVTAWRPHDGDTDLTGHLVLAEPDNAEAAIECAATSEAVAIAVMATADLPAKVVDTARAQNIAIATVSSGLSVDRLARHWNIQLVQARDRRAEEALDLHEQLARALLIGRAHV